MRKIDKMSVDLKNIQAVSNDDEAKQEPEDEGDAICVQCVQTIYELNY